MTNIKCVWCQYVFNQSANPSGAPLPNSSSRLPYEPPTDISARFTPELTDTKSQMSIYQTTALNRVQEITTNSQSTSHYDAYHNPRSAGDDCLQI